MTSETQRNFDDFNNMFKGIDRENCISIYIAVLVVDKVKLERNPFRSYDVDLWYDEIFDSYCRNNGIVQTSGSDTDVSDIED